MGLRIAIGLSIVAVLLIVLVVEGFVGSWERQILPNLVTEMIGIILTVTVIDGLLKWRQDAEERARAAREEAYRRAREEEAYVRMKPATESLLEPLGYLILGVQAKRPEKIIESIEELLSENLIGELNFLDPKAFLERAPATVGRRIVPTIEEFGNDVRQVVDNYGPYVPHDYRRVLNDLLPPKFRRISDLFRFSEDMTSTERNSAKDSLVVFCTLVRFLVEAHNKNVRIDGQKIEKMPLLFQRYKEYPGEYRMPDSARPNETTPG
jgi:hypothetical protein